MNDWELKRRAVAEERDSEKPASPLDAVRSATDFLVMANEKIEVLTLGIKDSDNRQKELAARQAEMHEQIRSLRKQAAREINVIAATFGATHVVTDEPEESNG